MKILHGACALSVACAALVSADKGFRPPTAASNSAINVTINTNVTGANGALDKFKKIKTAANFGKAGGKIEVCPSGDCTSGQSIGLSLNRLEEVDASGHLAVKAENFNAVDSGDWGDFVQHEVNGVAISSTSYTATLEVKERGVVIGTPVLNLTASIYAANGTTMNGNQSVSVPAGGLKFTLAISDWPFRATTDTLRFALLVKAKGNGTNPKALGRPEKKKLNGTATAKIDRVDFGEGMFMDAPSLAVLDGVSVDINASVETTASGGVEYVWVFPSFTRTLFYDPVVSSSDASAQATTDTTATTTQTPTATTATPTATPVATATPTPSSASGLRSVATVVFTGAATVAAFTLI